ncbi:hypothetical protein L3Q82_014531 [Scortum barcoo]|uniref:Uncharacterized protein n=1 Tax=Scortum barcoo TaxID=214431 RepID=A0ACB8VXM3_9TELE|nr:hypothetical protein L3Q82_014531 [Scortum barcoo]
MKPERGHETESIQTPFCVDREERRALKGVAVSPLRVTSDRRMSVCAEEEEEGAGSPGSICLSVRSDYSKDYPPDLSNEPGPTGTNVQLNRQRAESPGSICPSARSDYSKDYPPDFSNEPGPTGTKRVHRKRRRVHASVEEQRSGCALCQDVLKDPVSTSCGHVFCRQCITSHRDKSAFIRRLLLSPVWKKVQNKTWTTDSQSDQHSTKRDRVKRVNTQHEVRQLETTSKKKILHETPIKCHDIFKALT